MACSSALPFSLSWPFAASSALIAVSLMLTPYRSIGSASPRINDPIASTASAVDPPNCAARSDPSPMRFWVWPAKSATPLFFNPEPSLAASSW